MEEFKPIYTDLFEKKVNEIELKEDIDLRGISILNILYQMIHVDEYHLFVFFATTGILVLYPEFVTDFYTFYTLFLSFQNYMELVSFAMLIFLHVNF